MIEWIINSPWIVGIILFLLMWCDWILSLLQERERHLHYSEHYESYPINTIEGSPFYQSSILRRRIIEPKHFIPSVILSIIISILLYFVPKSIRIGPIGYVWGIYLIVITTHIGNLIGYRAERKGLHGKQYVHLRTAYIIQMGRYLALTLFLIILAIISGSLFIIGVAIAGATTTFRQLLWMRQTPKIEINDKPPLSK